MKNTSDIKKPFPNVLVKTKEVGARDVISFKMFIAMTGSGYWGRGKSLTEALDAAHALDKNRGTMKKIDIACWINIQTEADVMTAEGIESDARNGITHVGYEPGDYLKPFVDDYGGVRYRGALIKIDLPKNK